MTEPVNIIKKSHNLIQINKQILISFLDALQMGAAQFESSAGALKRKMWLKNLKVRTIFIT